MKARKKPVTIEAFQFHGMPLPPEIPSWLYKARQEGIVREHPTDDRALVIKTLEGDHKAIPSDYIIQGVNGELYPCKKEIFEKTYEIVHDDEIPCCPDDNKAIRPAEECSLGFGWALAMLKMGKKVRRRGWNGKGMFLTLQQGSSVDGEMMRNKPAKEYYTGKKCNICAHIDMKAADDTYVVGWAPSQTDMLAEDWELT